jgi:hypothetical protein
MSSWGRGGNRQWDEKTLRELIKKCLHDGENLTDWEIEFLESLSNQLDRNGQLSPRQEEILDRIYTNKCP